MNGVTYVFCISTVTKKNKPKTEVHRASNQFQFFSIRLKWKLKHLESPSPKRMTRSKTFVCVQDFCLCALHKVALGNLQTLPQYDLMLFTSFHEPPMGKFEDQFQLYN